MPRHTPTDQEMQMNATQMADVMSRALIAAGAPPQNVSMVIRDGDEAYFEVVTENGAFLVSIEPNNEEN